MNAVLFLNTSYLEAIGPCKRPTNRENGFSGRGYYLAGAPMRERLGYPQGAWCIAV